MLRAAAKNFKNTVSVCSPEHYHKIKPEGMSVEESRNLAAMFLQPQQLMTLWCIVGYINTQLQPVNLSKNFVMVKTHIKKPQ